MNGSTPAFIASAQGHYACVKLLASRRRARHARAQARPRCTPRAPRLARVVLLLPHAAARARAGAAAFAAAAAPPAARAAGRAAAAGRREQPAAREPQGRRALRLGAALSRRARATPTASRCCSPRARTRASPPTTARRRARPPSAPAAEIAALLAAPPRARAAAAQDRRHRARARRGGAPARRGGGRRGAPRLHREVAEAANGRGAKKSAAQATRRRPQIGGFRGAWDAPPRAGVATPGAPPTQKLRGFA